MNVYQRLFALFPHAESIAMAGIYGVKRDTPEFQLSQYIFIMPSKEEFDELYHPRLSGKFRKPDYYLIAISVNNRYAVFSKKNENLDDVLGSISFAHQALCIFHNSPYALGQIEGFLKNSMGSYGLSNPEIAGKNSEFSDPLFKQDAMSHSFNFTLPQTIRYDQDLIDFFSKLAKVCVLIKEKRWLLSAKKYTSGVNHQYAEDAILDFAVALESLLALDKEQINFKLRLYLALLVGDTYNERQQIYKDIKVFYGLRSKLVHGDNLSITDDQIKMISRVGNYLSKALVRTCGKKIKTEVLPDLEFMSLLGAPKAIKEKTDLIINEQDILNIILNHNEITEFESYRAYLSDEKNPDDECNELLLELTFRNGKTQVFDTSYYKGLHPTLRKCSSYKYWISSDSQNGFYYNVTF